MSRSQLPTTSPLIVITGPTASGKTGLALALAERYNGEIICADSRTVYKGMDIGTAKPTRTEQARVPHHGLDVVEPGQRFTAQDFQTLADTAIADIRARGKVPFLVGGTGLYIDAVTLAFQWPEQAHDPTQFEDHSTETLQTMIKEQHLPMPVNQQNRRHLVNVLTRGGDKGKSRLHPDENTVVVAISTDKDTLSKRIEIRAKQLFADGVVEEATQLAECYGWDSEAMSSNIYPIVRRLLRGELSQEEAINQFILRDKHLAKRQLTWLRRHDYVRWLSLDEARSYIAQLLGDGPT